MDFTLFVLATPNAGQGALSALHFARAAIAAGHRVRQVFFYGAGALASGRFDLPGDAIDVVAGFALLSSHGVELVACASSAARRGVAAEAASLMPGVVQGSLGCLAEALATSHRVLTFG